MKIPLAWLQLTHEKVRLGVALAGIAFADVLMFMQLGFYAALLQSATTFHQSVDGDVFLVSSQSTALIAMKNFSRRYLYEAMGVKGVRSVSPLYIEFAIWRNPVQRNTRSIMVIGFNPSETLLKLPGITENLDYLKLENNVLFDSKSRSEFGPVPDLIKAGQRVETEVSSHRVQVAGLFTMGASFGADGNIITSDTTFWNMFPRRSPGLIDVGVIHTETGADVGAIVARLREKLPPEVNVYSKADFVAAELEYWKSSTAIGFVFSFGTIMGFIVGTVIVYQILYTDVANHLPEYATLKAMGYRDSSLLLVVFQEAIILALIGYLPACGFASLLYLLAANATSLPIAMTTTRAAGVLVLTLIMCNLSGAIAVRKLQEADPADIF